ncbi:DUF523 domain-containing protein [Lachnospiraceae bacterium NSJ-143]|nr:DUF523 domain-containing protein [Lachnospiraceae bacterium NSJ-143]
MAVLISACLLGICCRYDCKAKKNQMACKLAQKEILIPVCPEQLGGRPTPRKPVEILNGRVTESDGTDHTDEFIRGAVETLKIAQINNIKTAVLKSNSPSCGFGKIYDGTFSKTLTDGNGITAELLSKNGVKILNEYEIEALLY